jgi:hypothetical protein
MGNIKVVATPEAYEWVMNSQSEEVEYVLERARSFVQNGLKDKTDKHLVGFSHVPCLCLRFHQAQSQDEDSFVIITTKGLARVNDLLTASFIIPSS